LKKSRDELTMHKKKLEKQLVQDTEQAKGFL